MELSSLWTEDSDLAVLKSLDCSTDLRYTGRIPYLLIRLRRVLSLGLREVLNVDLG